MTQSLAFKTVLKIVCILTLPSMLLGCFSSPETPLTPQLNLSAEQALAQKRQGVALGQVVYDYFQASPELTLLQSALTRRNEHIAQTPYKLEDQDRLELMKGAASLQVGMTGQAEGIFNRLLLQSTDPYVQANTWFWLAIAQKRLGASERAYTAIVDNQLQQELSDDDWQELVYQVSYERMNAGEQWQGLAEELGEFSIYRSYLQANQAVLAYNTGKYEEAKRAFVVAINYLSALPDEHLLINQAADSTWWSLFDWFGFAPDERQDSEALSERETLLDSLHYGLGLSLLAQKDFANAMSALQAIGQDSLQAEQAILTYGWALAQENRWPLAMAAWQYLRNNSQGIYALQASHGLAYGYEQLGALSEAYEALRDSSLQLSQGMSSLANLSIQAQQAGFFDIFVNTSTNALTQRTKPWPVEHKDLQVLLLSGDDSVDSAYLLDMRAQAKRLLNTLAANLLQIDGMYRLLDEREASFVRRSDALSLRQAKQQLDQIKQGIDELEILIASGKTAEHVFANTQQASALARLDKAQTRIERINTQRSEPLSAKYQQRVTRLKGILQWDLSETYPAASWRHQKQLRDLQQSYGDTKQQYARLMQIQNDLSTIQVQRERIDTIAITAQAEYQRSQALLDSLTSRLSDFLQANIAKRMQALTEQQVATRLGIVRLQDLAQPGREP